MLHSFLFFNREGGKFIMVIGSPCHEWVILYISRDLAHKSDLWWGIKCMVSECHLWCCPAACAFSYSFTIRLQICVEKASGGPPPPHFPFRLHKNGIPSSQFPVCFTWAEALLPPAVRTPPQCKLKQNKRNCACYRMVFLFKLFCKMALEMGEDNPTY